MALPFPLVSTSNMLSDFDGQEFDPGHFFNFDEFYDGYDVGPTDIEAGPTGGTGSPSPEAKPISSPSPPAQSFPGFEPKLQLCPTVGKTGFQHHSPEGSGDHAPRFRFPQAALDILEERYSTNRNVRKDDIKHLARLVHATPRQVSKWFSNRRNRERKEKKRAPVSAPAPVTARSSISFIAGEQASSVQQASASSPRNVTMSSATTPDCSISSGGAKRKSEDSSLLPKKKHQSDDEHVAQMPGVSSGITYQCTACCKEFSNQPSWQRHEETVCYSRRVWTCLANGWHSWKGQEPVVASNSCTLCELVDPPADHATNCKHRISDCLARPLEDRQFKRKDGLRSHCGGFHNFSPSDSMIDSWETSMEATHRGTEWDCGFCGMPFTNWAKRIKHIKDHFDRGLDMSSWMAAGKVQLRSLLIGDWSMESPAPQDLRLTYIEELGIIAYTINWGLRKVALRFFVGDVARIRPDEDELKPWKQEDEEAYIIELNVAPQFFFLTSDGRHWQRCADFTENRQASSYFVHTVIGPRNSLLADMMRRIDARRLEPVQDVSVDETILRAPMVLCSSDMSRNCPLCYQSFGRACGSLSHSMYTACPDCHKRVHREHNCTDLGNAALGSMFVCRGKLEGGRPWGCGAKFETYMMMWLHIASDPTCRRAFKEEQDQEREGDDLADLLSAGLRLDHTETGDGHSQRRSGPSVAITV